MVRARRMYKVRGTKITTPPLGTDRRLGCRLRPAGGGGGEYEVDGDRQRDSGKPG